MVVKYLIDADLPRALFRGLKRRDPALDVLRVQHVGLTTATDAEILSFAATDDRIVVSRDKATMSCRAAERVTRGDRMPGLFLVRPGFSRQYGRGIKFVIEELVLIAHCTDAEEWNGLIQYIPFLLEE